MGIGNWELGIGNWELGIGNCFFLLPESLKIRVKKSSHYDYLQHLKPSYHILNRGALYFCGKECSEC
ncbi:MAG TPA: hypothetical protein DD001_01990 [Microcoleaceae bacterium UBA10368]|nr:hypothetical protein [Microcoleaceae cyanobacterium UBA10368]HCV31537.1 hypothetical protein [Microcoleaceae cyanobacterium UBA9251]